MKVKCVRVDWFVLCLACTLFRCSSFIIFSSVRLHAIAIVVIVSLSFALSYCALLIKFICLQIMKQDRDCTLMALRSVNF
jgi:hypothetical protein